MTEPFTITVPGPLGENLGQNAHVHWRVKAKATQAARAEWCWVACRQVEDLLVSGGLEGVRLTFNAYFCRKRPNVGSIAELALLRQGYRPRDLDNLVAAMKPAVDGLVDAGLVEDDDKTRVRYGDHDITWVDTFAEERVEILVETAE